MKRILTTIFCIGLFAVLLMPRAADAISISPITFNYSLNPGDTVLDVLKIYNETDAQITVYPHLQNFTSKDETGEPLFYPADEDRDGTGLAKWITIDDEPITLAPKERANLQFAINVPADRAQPGGHYGVIMLASQPPGEVGQPGSGLTIGTTLGSLILVSVSGEVREVGRIAELAYEDPRPWYNHLPIDFILRFENSGNTHLRPVGNLFIKNWRDKQVASIKVNEDFSSVLPNSIRRFTFGWNLNDVPEDASELLKEWKNFALGKYTATLILNYGSANNIVSEERVFYVWPWRLLIALAVAVVMAVLLLWLLKRSYEKSIIAKHEAAKKRKK